MTATSSPPQSIPQGHGRVFDFRKAQRILRILRILRELRFLRELRAGGAGLPTSRLLLAGAVALIAAVALLVVLLPSAHRGWTEVAEGPAGAWDVAVRADAEATTFRVLGTEFFDRATVELAHPSPDRSVRAALHSVGGQTVMVGVATPDIETIRASGPGTGGGEIVGEVLDGPGDFGVFVAPLKSGAEIADVRVDGLSEQGEVVGSWLPAAPARDASG